MHKSLTHRKRCSECAFRGKPATTRQDDCAGGPGMSPPIICMPNGSLWHVGVATAGRQNDPSLSKVSPATSCGSRKRTGDLARQPPPGHQTPLQVTRRTCAWLRRFTSCHFYAKRLPVVSEAHRNLQSDRQLPCELRYQGRYSGCSFTNCPHKLQTARSRWLSVCVRTAWWRIGFGDRISTCHT